MLFGGQQEVLVYREPPSGGHPTPPLSSCGVHPLPFVRPFSAHSGIYLSLLYNRSRARWDAD